MLVSLDDLDSWSSTVRENARYSMFSGRLGLIAIGLKVFMTYVTDWRAKALTDLKLRRYHYV